MKLLLLTILTATTVAFADDIEAGKKIHTSKCVKCHKSRDPNNYDAATWDKWMVKMKKKAKLTDEQDRQLAEYLKTIRHPK